jgi:hypothetical protein
MSDTAVAATADNFGAHLAEVDSGGMDGGGAPDAPVQNDYGSGRQGATQLKQSLRQQADQHINPQHRVGDDGQPLQVDREGMMLTGEQGEVPQAEPGPDQEPEQDTEVMQGDTPPYEQLQEMYRVLEGPDLHEGLWDKMIPTPVNGVTVPKSIRELREGYMRMSDYSRGQQEKSQAMRQAQQFLQEGRATFERMQDPAVLRATLRKLGPRYEQALFQAAQQIAIEHTRLQRATPTEREAIMRAMDLERRAEAAEEVARRAPQEPQKAPHEQYVPHIHQTLEQVLPQTWQRHGLPPSPIAMQVFAQNIQYVWDGRMETIPQAVERATIATIEVLGDQAAQHRQYAQQQGPRQPQPLAPRRLPAPMAAPRAPNREQGRPRVTQFDDHLKRLG